MNKTGLQMSLEVCSHGFERSITLSMHFRSLCAKRFSHVLSSSVLEGKRFQRRPLCLCIGIKFKGFVLFLYKLLLILLASDNTF